MRYHVGYLTAYPVVKKGAGATLADLKPESIAKLSLQKDVDDTRQALKDINKAGRIIFEHAFCDKLQVLLNRGCKVLHLSGHVRRFCLPSVCRMQVCVAYARVCMVVTRLFVCFV